MAENNKNLQESQEDSQQPEDETTESSFDALAVLRMLAEQQDRSFVVRGADGVVETIGKPADDPLSQDVAKRSTDFLKRVGDQAQGIMENQNQDVRKKKKQGAGASASSQSKSK